MAALLILGISSCSSKAKWTKESLETKCNKEFKKKNETEKLFTADQLKTLCGCVADKMISQYKSEAEADKDPSGSSAIGRDCAMEVMQPQ